MDLNERIKSAVNEKLCKKGEAYRKRRMTAGAERKATVAKKVKGSKKGKQFVKNTKKAEYEK